MRCFITKKAKEAESYEGRVGEQCERKLFIVRTRVSKLFPQIPIMIRDARRYFLRAPSLMASSLMVRQQPVKLCYVGSNPTSPANTANMDFRVLNYHRRYAICGLVESGIQESKVNTQKKFPIFPSNIGASLSGLGINGARKRLRVDSPHLAARMLKDVLLNRHPRKPYKLVGMGAKPAVMVEPC